MKRPLFAPPAFVATFVLAFAASGLAQTAAPTTLHNFSGTNGPDPIAELTLDSDGNLYGTAASLGPNGDGTVFELMPTGVPTTLHAFSEGPLSPLIRNADGSFHGTNGDGTLNYDVGAGSITGNGNIFLLSASGVLTDLHDFAGTNDEGTFPSKGLVLAADGNYYGTIFTSGSSGGGTFFGPLSPGR